PMERSESTTTLRCGSLGSAGRLYVDGFESNRKNAFRPPRKPLVSAPYSCASLKPIAFRVSTRFWAFVTSSSRKPNWIESVGHALAQAGPSPLWMRSLQNVHFFAVPVVSLKLTTPNGHDETQ